MKKRIFSLLLAGMTALSVTGAAALEFQDGSSRVTDGAGLADLRLTGNAGGNYVRGNGSAHSPARSFLYENEEGGVSVVQVQLNTGSVTVADFDEDLNFLRTRNVSVKGRYSRFNEWGAFYAGEKYNYMIFLEYDDLSNDVLRIDCYTKDWTKWDGMTYRDVISARDIIANDLDVTESDGSLVIVSNYTIQSYIPEENGHEANFRIQVDSETLALQSVHRGVAAFDGYASHSFVPEVAANNGVIYAFDRADGIPGNGIFLSAFQGSLSSTRWRNRMVQGMTFRDWGSQGNAIAAGDGVLTAYTYAPGSQENTTTNVYLYYAAGDGSEGRTQVNYDGGAGTPYVAAVTENAGFVLWNPDPWVRDVAEDTLYYAAYTINGSSVTAGGVNRAEGHYLSDCEPIPFDGGLIWFTVSDCGVDFHQLKPNAAPTTKTVHTDLEVTERVEPTCAQPGRMEGLQCRVCGTVVQEPEVIPALPHTEQAVEALSPTCAAKGHTAGTGCAVCGAVLSGQEVLEKLPHTEEVLPGKTATCLETGLTEGKRCTVCEETLVVQEIIPLAGHAEVETPAVSPDYGKAGCTAGTKCSCCGGWLSGGEEIPAWCFRFHQISLYPYGENGMEYIINVTNDGDVPFWYAVNLYDDDGKLLKVQIFEGDLEDGWCRFPYLQDVGKIEAFALTKDLRPMGEKFVKTYANYTGP